MVSGHTPPPQPVAKQTVVSGHFEGGYLHDDKNGEYIISARMLPADAVTGKRGLFTIVVRYEEFEKK